MAEYDAIADEYAASKQLPWRVEVEQPTLFGLMGDVRGRSVLDLACGDGIYARMLADRGASRVHGVDLSGGMIELAQRAESARPRGITYSVSDASDVRGLGEFDVVMAAYLFNYAQDRTQLRRMAESAFRNLRPGGRLVLHEYVRWDTFSLHPHGEQLGRFVRRCIEHWRAHGADPDVASRLPALLEARGLRLLACRSLMACSPATAGRGARISSGLPSTPAFVATWATCENAAMNSGRQSG